VSPVFGASKPTSTLVKSLRCSTNPSRPKLVSR
jgi:hypothetical protein